MSSRNQSNIKLAEDKHESESKHEELAGDNVICL